MFTEKEIEMANKAYADWNEGKINDDQYDKVMDELTELAWNRCQASKQSSKE